MHPKDAEGIANSVDPDQEQSDLGLHCLPRLVCPKTKEHCGISSVEQVIFVQGEWQVGL